MCVDLKRNIANFYFCSSRPQSDLAKKAATEAAAANFLQVKRDLSVFVEVRGVEAGGLPSLPSTRFHAAGLPAGR